MTFLLAQQPEVYDAVLPCNQVHIMSSVLDILSALLRTSGDIPLLDSKTTLRMVQITFVIAFAWGLLGHVPASSVPALDAFLRGELTQIPQIDVPLPLLGHLVEYRVDFKAPAFFAFQDDMTSSYTSTLSTLEPSFKPSSRGGLPFGQIFGEAITPQAWAAAFVFEALTKSGIPCVVAGSAGSGKSTFVRQGAVRAGCRVQHVPLCSTTTSGVVIVDLGHVLASEEGAVPAAGAKDRRRGKVAMTTTTPNRSGTALHDVNSSNGVNFHQDTPLIFVDDLHENISQGGVGSPVALLRQLIDTKGFYSSRRTWTCLPLICRYAATCSFTAPPSAILERTLRSFTIIRLAPPTVASVQTVLQAGLTSWLIPTACSVPNHVPNHVTDFIHCLTEATIDIMIVAAGHGSGVAIATARPFDLRTVALLLSGLHLAKPVLWGDDIVHRTTPSRFNTPVSGGFYNTADGRGAVTRVKRSSQYSKPRASSEFSTPDNPSEDFFVDSTTGVYRTTPGVLALWLHEMVRVFIDSVFIDGVLDHGGSAVPSPHVLHPPPAVPSPHVLHPPRVSIALLQLVTRTRFPSIPWQALNPNGGLRGGGLYAPGICCGSPRASYIPVDLKHLRYVLKGKVEQYRMATGQFLPLVLTDYTMQVLVRIGRVLALPRGGGVLFGPHGCGRNTLVRFAAFLFGHVVYEVRAEDAMMGDDAAALVKFRVGIRTATDALLKTPATQLTILICDGPGFTEDMRGLTAQLLKNTWVPGMFHTPEGSSGSGLPLSTDGLGISKNIHIILTLNCNINHVPTEFKAVLPYIYVDQYDPWSRTILPHVALQSLTVLGVPDLLSELHSGQPRDLQRTPATLLPLAEESPAKARKAHSSTRNTPLPTPDLRTPNSRPDTTSPTGVAAARTTTAGRWVESPVLGTTLTSHREAGAGISDGDSSVGLDETTVPGLGVVVLLMGQIHASLPPSLHTLSTSKKYLDFIRTFNSVLQDRSRALQTKRTRARACCAHVATAWKVVGGLLAELAEAQAAVHVTETKYLEAQEAVTARVAELTSLAARRLGLDDQLAKLKAPIEALQEEERMERLNPTSEVQAAGQAFVALSRSDVEELRTYERPGPRIVLALLPVCLLFRLDSPRLEITPFLRVIQGPPTWAEVEFLLNQPDFFDFLQTFDRASVPDETLKQLQNYTNMPDYRADLQLHASKACVSIANWVRALVVVATLHKRNRPRSFALKKLLNQAAKASLALQELTERELYLCAHVAAEKANIVALSVERTAMMTSVASLETKIQRTNNFFSDTQSLHEGELRTIANCDLRLHNLVGDAIVAAALVTYTGTLSLPARDDLRQTWCVMCTELGTAVSADFSLPRFLCPGLDLDYWTSQGFGCELHAPALVEASHAWPLICDPYSILVPALSRVHETCVTVHVSDPALVDHVAMAVQTGTRLCVLGVEPDVCLEDLYPTLRILLQRGVQVNSQRITYLQIGLLQWPVLPGFRLYLLRGTPFSGADLQLPYTCINFNGDDIVRTRIVTAVYR